MIQTHPIQLSAQPTTDPITLRATIHGIEDDGRLRARFIRAGQTKPIANFPNGVIITAASLQTAVSAGLFNGAAIYPDHQPRTSQRSILQLAGFITNAEWSDDEQAAIGHIRLIPNDTGRNLEAIFETVRNAQREGQPIPDIGLSLDANFTFKRNPNGIPESIAMSELKSVDAVNIPAADGRILAAAQTNQGDTPPMLTQAQIDQRLAESGLASETITQLSAGTYADINALNQAIANAQNAAALATVEAQGRDEPQQQPAQLATNNQANAWLDAMQQTAVPLILANSNLPQASIDRLQNGRYQSPAQLNAAIQAETDYLAALAADETVQLNGRPRRGVTAGDMQTGEEEAANIVNWIFGVEGAPTPAYNMRRVDQLYVALSGDTNFTGVFDPTRVQLAASPTTLPNLALDAMNKVIAAQFARLRYYRWYELVAVVQPNDGSLHDMKWITYGGTGDLPQVADGAAYTEGNIGENKESDAFVKRGRYVGITRKMIKNSDIARMRAVPIALATDSVRTRSAQVAAIFTSNSGVGPTLTDGNALFHASRNNIATTALGTDTTAWEAASREIFDHVEVGSSKPIATFAKYNLVPSELYFQALKNFGYGDGSPTTYNPFAVADRSPEDPRPVVLPVPDFTDANDWAALADPNIWPVIMMSYSQNPGGSTHPQPELFTVTSELAGLMFTNDTMPIKVRDEYALGVNGGAGVSKRNVA